MEQIIIQKLQFLSSAQLAMVNRYIDKFNFDIFTKHPKVLKGFPLIEVG